MTWNLDEELGVGQLEPMIREFYDTLFDDVLVGFLFTPHDKESLVASQMRWLRAHLGDRSGSWDGGSIRALHEHLPILAGHFDRRHYVLRQLLQRWDVPAHVQDEWLRLDESLRPLVINLGAAAADALNTNTGKKNGPV